MRTAELQLAFSVAQDLMSSLRLAFWPTRSLSEGHSGPLAATIAHRLAVLDRREVMPGHTLLASYGGSTAAARRHPLAARLGGPS
jgi:hypothetical protein